MPHKRNGGGERGKALIASSAFDKYYGAQPILPQGDVFPVLEGGEKYTSHLVFIVTAPLDQSLGSSVASSRIRWNIGKALSEYVTETACDWNSVIYAPRDLYGSTVEARFQRLVSEWKADHSVSSNLTKLVMHPAYQQIIGMGERAIPLILRELKTEPDHWFWALKSISGVDPVSEQDRGNLPKMAEAWLEWGRKEGFC